jgi:DNA-binding CsgD family transcriptional regulator
MKKLIKNQVSGTSDQKLQLERIEDNTSLSPSSSNFMRQVMEGFIDGILILTETGRVLYANQCARELCLQLMQDFSNSVKVPQQVWRICQRLIESRELFPSHAFILEDTIITLNAQIRIRARWLECAGMNEPCLAVTLEDRRQSIWNTVMSDARKFGLTEREAEVWFLRRSQRTYRSIATELHIAIDTVKKHIKSIHAKRDAFID